MSIPDYIKAKQSQSKRILRSPSNTFIPPAIRNRQDKAEFSFVFNQAFLQSSITTNGQQLLFDKVDWFNKVALAKTIRGRQNHLLQKPFSSGQKSWELWFAFSMASWYNKIND